MRKPTEEQKAKAEARRAALRALANKISKMTPDERANLAARCSVLTIEGRQLSIFNQCFLALQMPDATVVGGFRQWLKAGRAVLKGQHGAGIWVPTGVKDGDTAAEDEATEPNEVRFIIGTVFDVSQTQEIATLEEVAA